MKIFVTGGAGFIGSALIRFLINQTKHEVINIDKVTYAGNLESLIEIENNPRYQLETVDICDADRLAHLFTTHNPDAVMHLAAESHVDRSIDGPSAFIQTNIIGTYTLLEEARKYWEQFTRERQKAFKFHHISTDEVYGSLGKTGLFNEESRYEPNSPYSASKASSDHLVRAWHATYRLPIVITNCSNNYGPYQFPEKLIPLVILNALDGKELPVYGSGEQVRDWLYVDDHAKALYLVLQKGKVGETYNIGGNNEKTNLEVVKSICRILDDVVNQHPDGVSRYEELITHVPDRPGHDQRYAINPHKIMKELGWKPNESFESGIRKTVEWYLENREWCQHVQDGSYRRERLGLRTSS